MVTYCLPSRSQVIGWPMIPDGVWNCHRILPVSLSTAMNSPVSSPVNTNPPAVTSVPAQFGLLNGIDHFALPVSGSIARRWPDRKSTRLNSSHVRISYAVFCLKKKPHTHYPPCPLKKKKKKGK